MKKFTLLESGDEFFGDLLKELESARESVLIKQFLWRNDATGQKVAKSLLACLARGVKVSIIKDRIGAIYEYGESVGQSFFHDDPLHDSFFEPHSLATLYFQSHFLFSKFYKNSVSKQVKNPLRAALVNHPLSTVMDSYKLYDHSKVVIIDGRLAYLGGIGFADEFNDGEDRWLDYMLKITDGACVRKLLKVLAGEKIAVKGGLENRFHIDGHDRVLEIIREAEKELVIEMPFWGNTDYLNALAGAAKKGVNVYLHLSRKAPSHHYRNLHFLKTLIRRAGNTTTLHVSMSPRIIHGKCIVSDGKLALFGSHNLHMDSSVLREITLESTDQGLVSQLRKRLMRNIAESHCFLSTPSWAEIIFPSRLEYFSIKLQTFFRRLRSREIERARTRGTVEIGKLFL